MPPKIPEKLYVLEKDEKFVFVDQNTGAWIRTNHVGYDVLMQCDGTREPADIAREIAALYEVPVELIQPEIESFIKNSLDEEIVFDTASPAAPVRPSVEPNTVWFHVTRRCNLSCVHCYAGGSRPLNDELSIGEINAALASIAAVGPYLVYITGGEPLMRPDLWQIEPGSLRLRLITNGTLVDEENVPHIARLFKEVQVSIDGPDRETHQAMRPQPGSFDAALRAIRLLSQVKFERRIISCTATRLNYTRIPEMVQWAYDQGWSLFLSRLTPAGKATMEHYLEPEAYNALVDRCHQAYIEVTKTRGRPSFPFFFQAACTPYNRVLLNSRRSDCGIGSLVISIDASGDVYPCPLLQVPEFKIGNLRETPVAELVQRAGTGFEDLAVDHLDTCRDCYVKHLCGGGCRALAYYCHRGITGADPFCAVTRRAIETAFWL